MRVLAWLVFHRAIMPGRHARPPSPPANLHRADAFRRPCRRCSGHFGVGRLGIVFAVSFLCPRARVLAEGIAAAVVILATSAGAAQAANVDSVVDTTVDSTARNLQVRRVFWGPPRICCRIQSRGAEVPSRSQRCPWLPAQACVHAELWRDSEGPVRQGPRSS